MTAPVALMIGADGSLLFCLQAEHLSPGCHAGKVGLIIAAKSGFDAVHLAMFYAVRADSLRVFLSCQVAAVLAAVYGLYGQLDGSCCRFLFHLAALLSYCRRFASACRQCGGYALRP